MKELELQTGYIADAILQTKMKKFNENFTTIEEVNIIKQLIQERIKQRNLKVVIFDRFFEKYFDIINGIITKADKKTATLKPFICDVEIAETIYDENFICLCLYEIMTNKFNNSIPHNCSTCDNTCYNLCAAYEKWSHDFEEDCKYNLSVEERQLIEKIQFQQVDEQKISRKITKHNKKKSV